jgi:hypothetical protein
MANGEQLDLAEYLCLAQHRAGCEAPDQLHARQLVPAGRPPPSGLLLFPNFKVAFRKTVSRAMMR